VDLFGIKFFQSGTFSKLFELHQEKVKDQFKTFIDKERKMAQRETQ
jgi:hypothetical protein